MDREMMAKIKGVIVLRERAKSYADQDDCLAWAAAQYADDNGYERWEVEAEWEDEDDRGTIVVRVVGRAALEAITGMAIETVEAAGAAGGIDEVKRLADKGWPESRELGNDSPELRAAIQAEAKRLVAEAGESW